MATPEGSIRESFERRGESFDGCNEFNEGAAPIRRGEGEE
jgi:hypothetical protein